MGPTLWPSFPNGPLLLTGWFEEHGLGAAFIDKGELSFQRSLAQTGVAFAVGQDRVDIRSRFSSNGYGFNSREHAPKLASLRALFGIEIVAGISAIVGLSWNVAIAWNGHDLDLAPNSLRRYTEVARAPCESTQGCCSGSNCKSSLAA
jgi:hypothetical protein